MFMHPFGALLEIGLREESSIAGMTVGSRALEMSLVHLVLLRNADVGTKLSKEL